MGLDDVGFRGAAAGATALPPVGPVPDAPPDTTPPPLTPAGDYQYAAAPAPTVPLVSGRARTQYFGTVLVGDLGLGPGALGLGAAPGGPAVARRPAARRGSARHRRGRAPPRRGAGTDPGQRGRPRGRSAQTRAAPVEIGAAVVRTAGQGTYRVDGALRDAVTSPRWRLPGHDRRLLASSPSRRRRAGPGCKGCATSAAHVVSSTPWGDETVRVTTTRPATLGAVRAIRHRVAGHGHHRRRRGTGPIATPGGATSTASSRPWRSRPGTSLVHFTYRPHRVLEGFVASGLGFIVLVGLVAWPVARRRRRGSGARHPAAR